RWLANPSRYGGSIPPERAVTFARNHDTDMNSNLFAFPDYPDALLASAYVPAKTDRVPTVLNADSHTTTVLAGLRFRQALASEPGSFWNGREICKDGMGTIGGHQEHCDNPNLLFIKRGSRGFALINKAAEWFDTDAAKFPGMEAGCYYEHHYGFPV